MSDAGALLYRLKPDTIDNSLHDWLRLHDPSVTTWESALASRHGFTLATLLDDFGGITVANPRFSPTSSILWHFAYWLFVPAYAQHVERANGFHAKSVLLAEALEESGPERSRRPVLEHLDSRRSPSAC